MLFDSIYEFLNKNCLLRDNQSGFRPNDSSIHQLIAITHDIFTAFDVIPSLVVRAAFLDLSKVFNKVLHKRLFYKFKCNGISCQLLSHLEESLFKQIDSKELFGKSSNCKNVRAGIPQGLV